MILKSCPALCTHRAALAALISLVLSACSLEPHYVRPDAPVAPGFPQGPAYGDQRAAPGNSTAAGDLGWRDFLTDPHLQRLVAIALANNRDLRVAVLNVQQLQPNSAFNPQRCFRRCLRSWTTRARARPRTCR